MVSFAFLEVGFIDGIVRISGALDLDVPLNGVLLARSSPTWCGLPSLSHDSPKKTQFLPPCCSKYFRLSQREGFFGCLRRAHCHRRWKIAWSTLEKMHLLTTCR